VGKVSISIVERDNGNVHRAAANIMQAEKAARPAAPCATYCFPSISIQQDDLKIVMKSAVNSKADVF
jgi:hypothetical protein